MNPAGYLVVSALLFCIGALGVIVRKNAIVVFMCVELMLNAVNLTFVALTTVTGNLDGQIAVFFVMVVAAAESAIGLAIILGVFRNFKSAEVSVLSELKR